MFLSDRVTEYFEALPDFSTYDRRVRILIGFSGGPDSVCLMSVLSSLSEKLNTELCLAYFNHRIRPENELAEEISFIRKMASEYGLKLWLGEDKGEIEKESGALGVEGAARKARYRFFDMVMAESGSDYLALAHNLDDTVETVVMRFFKGSGLSGLRGIPSVRGNIIRPLCRCSKSEILRYLWENNLQYSVDKTNFGTDYLRNRVRNVLLPQIGEIFPNYAKAVSELGEKVSAAHDFIKEAAEQELGWEKEEEGYSVSYDAFMAASDAVRTESLYSCFDRFARGQGGELPFRFVKTALAVKSLNNNGILLRGHGFVIRRQGDRLFWKKEAEKNTDEGFFIEIKEKNNNFFNLKGNRGFSVEKSLLSLCNKEDIWLPADKVTGCLTVRSRRNGDTLVSAGCNKKLKKIFSEWKVPADIRSRIPLICDDRGVLAVWGGMYGFKDRVSDLVRVESGADEIGDVYIFRIRQDSNVR